MATVTTDIGGGNNDYATITAWEADLDNGAVYNAGDDAVGLCYDNGAFDESLVFNGGTTIGLNSVTLSVPAAERHDGTAGTGARVIYTGGERTFIDIPSGTLDRKIEWLELSTTSNTMRRCIETVGTTLIDKCIIHRIHSDHVCYAVEANMQTDEILNVHNTIIYDITSSQDFRSDRWTRAIRCWGGMAGTNSVCNCTIYNVVGHNTSDTDGILMATDSANNTMVNNIVVGTDNTSTGTPSDFNPSSLTNTTTSHNISSDTTASGTGSITNAVIADQFVSIVDGSEDLHIKTGSDAIDAGTNLGSTPTGINIDIDGTDRIASPQGPAWDIGAHEFISAVAPKLLAGTTLLSANLDSTLIAQVTKEIAGNALLSANLDSTLLAIVPTVREIEGTTLLSANLDSALVAQTESVITNITPPSGRTSTRITITTNIPG